MTAIERDAKIAQMSEDIALIKQALTGNGTKGLNERVEELEKEKENRPKETRARLALQTSAIAVVFAGIEIAGKLLRWW